MLAAFVAAGCGGAQRAALDPATTLWPRPGVPRFAASGRVHFESNRGDIDGRIQVRVDPPHRVWLELRADAVFGLVGERIVVSAPGDGWLVTYEERADRLERVLYSESWLAGVEPSGSLEHLLEWATARLPWPADAPAPAPRLAHGRWVCDLEPAGSPGVLRVDPGDRLLRRLDWVVDGGTKLQLEYGEPQPCGADWLPGRLRGRAGDVRVDLRLERIEPRKSFADAEFDLDGTPAGREG